MMWLGVLPDVGSSSLIISNTERQEDLALSQNKFSAKSLIEMWKFIILFQFSYLTFIYFAH